jgi:hypothetical protein
MVSELSVHGCLAPSLRPVVVRGREGPAEQSFCPHGGKEAKRGREEGWGPNIPFKGTLPKGYFLQ